MTYRTKRGCPTARGLVCAALLCGTLGALPEVARSQTKTTERGLDLWLHAPSAVAGGDTLPIDVLALGFPSATRVAPLPQTVVEAVWDPESLSDPTKKTDAPAVAPPPVRAITDDAGRAVLNLPVPKGPARQLKLLVSVKTADRERVRELTIAREAAEQFDLFLSDARVVPGSEVVAWALWTSRDRSRPVQSAPIEFVLSQGGIVRFRKTSVTDPAGASMVRVPIPRDDEPGARWTLTARAASGGESLLAFGPQAETTLIAREETPGKPSFWSSFEDGSVTAGGKAKYRIRVRDASGEGIAGHAVFVWSGPRGTEPPKDLAEFKKVAQALTTDGAGEIRGEIAAPTTIPLRGTELKLEARTDLEGQPRSTTSNVDVGQKRGFVTLTAEAGELVPGLEQRVVVELTGDDYTPLVGRFSAKGDGLDATFTTNKHGEAEISWKVPKGIGAKRDTGPCPGTVAAQVTLRALEGDGAAKRAFGGALGDSSGLPLCIPVRREGTMILRPEKLVVREGEALPLRVIGGERRAASLIVQQASGAQAVGHWTKDASTIKDLKVPAGASGLMTVHLAAPKSEGPSETLAATVLVLPKQLPKIVGQVSGGRAVPAGKVTVSATLSDEGGKPLTGSVAAVVIDKLGGGSFGPLGRMDTRDTLCGAMSVEPERCEQALLGGAEMDPLRRARLRAPEPIAPMNDPAATAKTDMDATFRTVVRSLEGAVFEASQAVETLPDVRRKEGAKYVFNPELMTLVTDAMDQKPLTPGGEPVSLADVIAIDNQITYDKVARRVARLKLFSVLSTLRSSRMGMDVDEPIFTDPNVFLRKLLREGTVNDAGVIDPWGGRLSFYKGATEHIPFVSVKKGWELRSPGPDGKLGTGDDVKSPFERVLTSNSPYARATDEDEVVDARYDMLVSDATVENWSNVLSKATGTALGGAEGIGLGSVGSVGHGSGFGSGSGRLGGSSRSTGAIAKGVAFVSAPMRTDAQGRVSIEIPLGDVETTWLVALVGLPDQGRAAVTTVEIPVTVPLSAKVNAGAIWTDKDEGQAVVQVRNRTDKPLDVDLALSTRGALSLAPGDQTKRVRVEKQGVALVDVQLQAVGSGKGYLQVKTTAPGVPSDQLSHEIEVRPRGELVRIARTTWVQESVELFPYLTRKPFTPQGTADLVLERGDRAALESALESLNPERPLSFEELSELTSAVRQLEDHFVSLEGDGSKTAKRAREIGRAATAKLATLLNADHPHTFSWWGRALAAGFVEKGEIVKLKADCPSERAFGGPTFFAAALDAEPTPEAGGVRDCWTLFAARATNQIEDSGDVAAVARAILALSTRGHRNAELSTLKKRLNELAEPDDDGTVTLPAGTTRAGRALVYAALLVATELEKKPAWRAKTVRWLLVQRDAAGSFGSVAATRGAVQALIREAKYLGGNKSPLLVKLDFGKGGTQELKLAQGETKRVKVPMGSSSVTVSPEGGPVMARLERNFLRSYDIAPEKGDTAVEIEVVWPTAPDCTPEQAKKNACPTVLTRGKVANLRLTLRNPGMGSSSVDARIPLPVGVSLADNVGGVRQIQGALHVRADVSGEQRLVIPVRFGLAGTFIAREATARAREDQSPAAIARARPVVVAK